VPTDGDEPVEPGEPTEALEPVEPVGDEPADAPKEPRKPLFAEPRAVGFFAGFLIIGLVMALIAGLAVGDDDDDSSDLAVEDRTTTTVAEEEETTTTLAETTTTSTALLTGGDASATTTTTAALVCRNSTNRACGRFRFDPAPGGNQVMQVNATIQPPNPQAGQTVTFTFAITDDAVPTQGNTDFGDGSVPTSVDRCSPRRTEGFGPWTPPTRTVANHTIILQHVYAQPGTYRFQGTLNSSSWGTATPPGDARGCPRDPYADTVTLEATIPVA
jgi:hypothetical protein